MSKIQDLYSASTQTLEHSFVREIIKITKGVEGMISFAGGMPSPESFPTEILAKLFKEAIEEEGKDILQYGATDGDKFFKKTLLEYEKEDDVKDDELMITVGSTNGIYYFTRTLIDKGDIIITEAPSFTGSISAMEACGAVCEGIPMDEEGMVPEILKNKVNELRQKGEKVKFIYIIPEFQNPTGKTMSLQRRREIIQTAIDLNLPILEDSPYRELRYSGERLTTLWNLAIHEFKRHDVVVIAKSFSKILGPGLRLGFASGAKEFIEPMIKWSQRAIVSPDCVTQRAAGKFIKEGYMNSHIKKLISIYKPRRDAMLKSLEEFMPNNVKWTIPEGGMFVWVTLDENINTDKLFHTAVENKVAFIPGSKFYPENNKKFNELRLNFSYPDENTIRKGIKRLADLIKNY